MELTEGQKKLITLVKNIGFIQGIAWTIMSIICIIVFNNGATFEITNYSSFYSALLYTFFLDGDYVIDDYTIKPRSFALFMWIYILLSVIWTLISLCIPKVRSRKFYCTCKYWIITTYLISIVDAILCILLGIDFNKCLANADDYSFTLISAIANEMVCYNIYLPMMTFAVRGYVLWIVNIMFACTLKRLRATLRNSTDDHTNAESGIAPKVIASNMQPPNFMPNTEVYSNYLENYGMHNAPPTTSPHTSGQFYQNPWPNQSRYNSNTLETAPSEY